MRKQVVAAACGAVLAAGADTIAAFDRHADGSLTPTPGSPFPAGGVRLGGGLGSQGAVQASPDRRFLLAVDAGSNQISVLRMTSNGAPSRAGLRTIFLPARNGPGLDDVPAWSGSRCGRVGSNRRASP